MMKNLIFDLGDVIIPIDLSAPIRNFAMLAVSGPLAARQLRIGVHNHAGALLWERSISAAELK